jgi:hypothetical protein
VLRKSRGRGLLGLWKGGRRSRDSTRRSGIRGNRGRSLLGLRKEQRERWGVQKRRDVIIRAAGRPKITKKTN